MLVHTHEHTQGEHYMITRQGAGQCVYRSKLPAASEELGEKPARDPIPAPAQCALADPFLSALVD